MDSINLPIAFSNVDTIDLGSIGDNSVICHGNLACYLARYSTICNGF